MYARIYVSKSRRYIRLVDDGPGSEEEVTASVDEQVTWLGD